MKILPLIMTSAVLLLSCDKKKEQVSEKVAISSSDSVKVVGSGMTEKGTVTESVPATAVASNATNPNNSAKPALNPEHGKPFHRCDISVGAPIDSAPPQNAAPQVAQPQPQMKSSSFNTNPISPTSAPVPTPVSAPQATGPKPATNPAHGQPHHRCDLQVGAPLT